ncbi:MAG: alpha/beta hydrolase [Chitinophagaceae bacterium]|jgi:pimeloyl-ACP methyl ester carboxylesterase|nr:alpha/beta hydrolase [Chitinophagaceae bacterium]
MQKTLSTVSGQLSYFLYGKGEPVVLIHGFGEDSRIWKQQIQFLQNRFQLIIPDLRGSGASTLPEKQLTIESMADDLYAILRAENIQPCILLGHSMGGYITLAFAEKYPEMLAAFGLIHSTAYADSDEKKAARKKSIAFINEHSAFEFIQTTIPNLFSAAFNKQQKHQVLQLTEQGRQFSKEALTAYYEAMIARPDRTEVLKNSTVPVLFFIGEEDKAVNPGDMLKQSSLPAVSQVLFVNGIAHMGMLEATGELNTCIDEFVTTVQQLHTVEMHK